MEIIRLLPMDKYFAGLPRNDSDTSTALIIYPESKFDIAKNILYKHFNYISECPRELIIYDGNNIGKVDNNHALFTSLGDFIDYVKNSSKDTFVGIPRVYVLFLDNITKYHYISVNNLNELLFGENFDKKLIDKEKMKKIIINAFILSVYCKKIGFCKWERILSLLKGMPWDDSFGDKKIDIKEHRKILNFVLKVHYTGNFAIKV